MAILGEVEPPALARGLTQERNGKLPCCYSLNQKGLDSSYTDYFGNTHTVKQREDVQLNKFFLPLSGWFLTPKFKYYLYVWYFWNLVVKSKEPVVLTASMRPSTALSADGPLNFFNAVAVAANQDAAGRGVLVVVNDWIHGASSLTKANTTAVQTFSRPSGA